MDTQYVMHRLQRVQFAAASFVLGMFLKSDGFQSMREEI